MPQTDSLAAGIASNQTLYLYGFLFSYGIGFGGPLLLGQDSDVLDCDSNTFVKLLNKGRTGRRMPDLSHQPYYDHVQGFRVK